MTTFKHPFGEPDQVQKADDNKTPEQKKFEAKTGKDADNAVGDTTKSTGTKRAKKEESNEDTGANPAPKGVDKEAWAAAEQAVINQTGGFAGQTPEGRQAQIQRHYDSIEASNKQTRAWEGKEDK
jgi:hypothetical protein